MSDNHIIEDGTSGQIIKRDDALLDIFSEENMHCHNLREMNTALTRCFNALRVEVNSEGKQLARVTPQMLKTVGDLLRGKEIRDAEGLLVADLDAVSKEIQQKIKKGIYKIAESKQIDGNLRAAIVDKKGKIIKQITLKYADGNKIVAGDLNTMAIQAALRGITRQLDCIDAGVHYLIKLQRRGDFQTPYFDAVKKIIEANQMPDKKAQRDRVQSAIDDLNHGLHGLYGDLDDCIKTLQGKWIPIYSKRNLDFISEDMVYIPQYVALLAYLYNLIGLPDMARDTIQYYRDEINSFISKKLSKGYTAAQLVHSRYAYSDKNMDFWMDGMHRIQSEMAMIRSLPSVDGKEVKPVYLLEFIDVAEDDEDV